VEFSLNNATTNLVAFVTAIPQELQSTHTYVSITWTTFIEQTVEDGCMAICESCNVYCQLYLNVLMLVSSKSENFADLVTIVNVTTCIIVIFFNMIIHFHSALD